MGPLFSERRTTGGRSDTRPPCQVADPDDGAVTRSNDRNHDRCAPRSAPTEEHIKMDWRNDAACRDEDPELFFPVGTSGPALSQIARAKSVCRRCPAMTECLKWALESGQDAGVWGGASEDERRALKRHGIRPEVHTSF
ncbi:hypothetical protein GCM10023200_20090 [Actinomycetospora chlora]|uniref:Transcriptional regulator WhiB n=2 Tax=Actinomycetospora chlora TaxID=663608 RepID=A0ABP9AVT4_9PSEU